MVCFPRHNQKAPRGHTPFPPPPHALLGTRLLPLRWGRKLTWLSRALASSHSHLLAAVTHLIRAQGTWEPHSASYPLYQIPYSLEG